MLLQSHQSFDLLADYDPATKTFATFSRKAEPARGSSERCRGVFDELGGKLILLYRLGDDLFLEVDGRRMSMERLVIELQPSGGERILRASTDGSVILELKGDPPDPALTFSDDPTAFAEEEDFDFGLFLANVSRDRARQDRMYTES